MKKTLNVNIGSVAFVIDEDAYYILRKYLDDVGERFLMFLLIFFGGISLWVYIILWIVIPSEA